MKKVLVGLLIVAVLVLGFLQLRTYRLSFGFQEGKTAKIVRGSLTVPINATGEVMPARRIEIKAEASGEVLEILRRPGDLVRKGEMLIRLDKAEETRNKERAEHELHAAEARLEITKLKLRNIREVEVKRANERVTQLEAQLEQAQFRYDKTENLRDRTEDELIAARAALATIRGDLEQARATQLGMDIQIRMAEQDVIVAQAAVESARRNLGDANERLIKTDIVAPIDGMVGEVHRQIGEVIQGGKTTITGGTLLATIIDTGKIIVRAEVDEADIGEVMRIAPAWAKPGNDASAPFPSDWIAQSKLEDPDRLPVIHVDAFRDEKFIGIIEGIRPEPRRVQETVYYYVDVVLVSDNRDKLFSGMRADVSFTLQRVDNVLLCPEEAIVKGLNDRFGVHVPDTSPGADPRAYKFVPCELGLSNSVYSEVISGLKEGDIVYTKLPVSASGSSTKK